jgi:hypothetical protein
VKATAADLPGFSLTLTFSHKGEGMLTIHQLMKAGAIPRCDVT